jgi:hypothetical protein
MTQIIKQDYNCFFPNVAFSGRQIQYLLQMLDPGSQNFNGPGKLDKNIRRMLRIIRFPAEIRDFLA